MKSERVKKTPERHSLLEAIVTRVTKNSGVPGVSRFQCAAGMVFGDPGSSGCDNLVERPSSFHSRSRNARI